MSIAPAGLHDCPDIQAELDGYFATCQASELPDNSPLNDYLWSGANRSGIEQLLQPGSNKVRTLQLRYDQRLTEDQVEEIDSCERVCTATTKRGDLVATYEIDTCDKLRVSELINANDFKAACRDNFTIVNKKMTILIKGLMAKIATRVTERALAHIGPWAPVAASATTGSGSLATVGGVRTLILSTKKTGSTDVNPEAIEDLNFALKSGFLGCAGVGIFGGRTLDKYMNLMEKGCCSNQGLDLGALFATYKKAFMWDRRVQDEMGSGDLSVAIGLGALQPVTYTANNDGINDALGLNIGANYQKQVIYIPGWNIPVDLTISDDCGNISIIMEANVDVKGMPSDLFAPSDYLSGVNGVAKIKVINA